MIKLLEEAFGFLKRLDDSMGSEAIPQKNYAIILEQLNELKDDIDNLDKRISKVIVSEKSPKKQFISTQARLNVFLVDVLTDVNGIHKQLVLIARKCSEL